MPLCCQLHFQPGHGCLAGSQFSHGGGELCLEDLLLSLDLFQLSEDFVSLLLVLLPFILSIAEVLVCIILGDSLKRIGDLGLSSQARYVAL